MLDNSFRKFVEEQIFILVNSVFFLILDKFVKRLGHIHCLSLVVASFGVRFLLYSMLENPWYSLPIEILQGPTVALMFVSMVGYAYKIAPTGGEGTMQGVMGGVMEGIGELKLNNC